MITSSSTKKSYCSIFDIQYFTIAEKIEVAQSLYIVFFFYKIVFWCLQNLSIECFTVMVIMAILLPTIVTPIVAYIYNPSSQYRTAQKRGIHATKYNLEFKIMSCIHWEDNIPTLISVFAASNPTRKSPISAYDQELVELVGQIIPLFISSCRINRRFKIERERTDDASLQ